MKKVAIIIPTLLAVGCAQFSRVDHPELASIEDGASFLIFKTETDPKFITKNSIPDHCFVEPECTRRVQSHYQMRDTNNTVSEYFFDIDNDLHAVRIAPNSTGDYFLQFVGPSLASRWAQSTRLYVSVPEQKTIYHLGTLRIDRKRGQLIIDYKDTDKTAFRKQYPQFKNITPVKPVSWRHQRDRENLVNMQYCKGSTTVGITYGTVGATGYRSTCYFPKRKELEY